MGRLSQVCSALQGLGFVVVVGCERHWESCSHTQQYGQIGAKLRLREYGNEARRCSSLCAVVQRLAIVNNSFEQKRYYQ